MRGHEAEIKKLPAGWTFMFELTSPYNKIVVPYKTTTLTLLGCRDDKGTEHTPEWAKESFGLTFETPQVYPLKTIDDVIAYCESIDSNNKEGVVIQDGNFNRIKIKSEYYRNLFFLKGEDHFSDERLFWALKHESIDDALAAWPEIRPRTDEITAEWLGFKKGTRHLCDKGAAYYAQCRADSGGDAKLAKKQYAMFVLEKYKTFSGFLFEAVKENADLETVFNKIEYRELKSYWLPAMESIAG